jgi:hypothetical protein
MHDTTTTVILVVVLLLGTLKYDWIDIQSKVFDGSTCIPTLYRLLKNCANTTRTGS